MGADGKVKQKRREKRFRSMVYQVVLWPMLLVVLIMIILFGSIFMGLQKIQQQTMERHTNSLQVYLNQMRNFIDDGEARITSYVVNNRDYVMLRSMTEDNRYEDYFTEEARTRTWLEQCAAELPQLDGTFAYFRNIHDLMFRGRSNYEVQKYVAEQLNSGEGIYNQWYFVELEDRIYLINIERFGDSYFGYWTSMEKVLQSLRISGESFRGIIYLQDGQKNYCTVEMDNQVLTKADPAGRESVYIDGTRKDNYAVTDEHTNLSLGLLAAPGTLLEEIPLLNKILIGGALIALLFVPVLMYWLKRRISRPIAALTDAMHRFGQGDLEYRIAIDDRTPNDEFLILYDRLNHMADNIVELEFNLYRTKMKEQETELKYISQQIRPHFILNALNVIYTYREDEFPLVKKMVLYLTNYFRYIVNLKVDFVRVQDELRHIENYLKIQKERYLDKFEFFVEWAAEVEDCLIPPLIIQTFVENSIKHAMTEERMFIYVLASEENGKLKLMMADTGQGFSEEVMKNIHDFVATREEQSGLGIGIENAIERMDILYEEAVDFRVRNALTGGAVVEIYLPVKR